MWKKINKGYLCCLSFKILLDTFIVLEKNKYWEQRRIHYMHYCEFMGKLPEYALIKFVTVYLVH